MRVRARSQTRVGCACGFGFDEIILRHARYPQPKHTVSKNFT